MLQNRHIQYTITMILINVTIKILKIYTSLAFAVILATLVVVQQIRVIHPCVFVVLLCTAHYQVVTTMSLGVQVCCEKISFSCLKFTLALQLQ